MAMRLGMHGSLLILCGALVAGAGSSVAEEFRRLKSAEIRSRLAGMEITDGVHWAEQYMRDGTFKAVHMGKSSKGKWLPRNDELCLEAIQQHMSHEQPRYLFLHYWGKGKAADLAQSLKRILDAQAAVKS